MGRRADSSRVAFWRELIERRRHSGLSVARLCADVGVSPASFYKWQRKLRGKLPRAGHAQPDQATASRLVPVRIVPDAPTGRAGAAGMLEIELPGEIRLRIPAGCDRATLQLALSMLLKDGSREGGSC
jgi:transposase-like protein